MRLARARFTTRSLMQVAAAAAILAPAFWIAALARSQPSQQAQTNKLAVPSARPSEPAKLKGEKEAKPPVIIQGKPLAEWMAALNDLDPAARKRAVEVLGTATKDQAGDQWSKLHGRILSMVISDKDLEVRKAAAAAADDLKVANSPAIKKRIEQERQRTVAPTLTPLRLVDARGGPVAGAGVADFFWRDDDREPSFTPTESSALKTSDERGEASLKLEIPGHLDGTGIFAIRQGKGRPLVGLHKVTREEIGKPITIGMYPACRVLFRIDSAGLPALEKKFNAELTGPGWWRAAYLRLGGDFRAPRPLFTCSTTGALEFLLPPGRFTIYAYGNDVKSVQHPVEIEPDDRELLLGTIDLAPSEDAEQGRFPNHRRVWLNEEDDEKAFVLRRIHHMSLHGDARGVHDVAFSPDGKILATAHAYNAGPGEVKLWAWATGTQIAKLTVPGKAVVTLAFSRDGKFLAGLGHALAEPRSSWGIVLWDIASRREVRTLGGHTGRILALASSPDGKTLASSGADKTTRFWDIASGREIGRIGSNGVCGQSLVFAPNGQTLAVGTGQTIKLWDVAGDHLRATLEVETGRFTLSSVAYSPDGRTLAAAGSTHEPKRKSQEGQVRLYDVAHEPVRRRAVLTFDREEPGVPNQVPPLCSDVAFTPDGRRVIAVAMQHVRTWDVATGIEQAASQRGSSSSSDRLAVSPDGRWLAITMPYGVDIVDIPPAP